MRILAVIPARGESKRVPRKNIRLLGGKPLINWTIEAALGNPDICDIIVSTDDHEIASIARAAGARTPWLRPKYLATDEASSVDVAVHALDWYESEYGEINGCLLLQPTSPFRTSESISRGIDLFKRNELASIIGVSPISESPVLMMKSVGALIEPYCEDVDPAQRSQDFPEIFIVNGAFYLIEPSKLRAAKSFYSIPMYPLLFEKLFEGMDIDTEDDFLLSEDLMRERNKT